MKIYEIRISGKNKENARCVWFTFKKDAITWLLLNDFVINDGLTGHHIINHNKTFTVELTDLAETIAA